MIRVKSATQDIALTLYVLEGFRTFGDKIARFFIPQDLLKNVFQSFSSI